LIYVILGMHKSGTTLVSQILHYSGINMGENIDAGVSYDQGNKYERASIMSLNLEILGLKTTRIIDFDAPGTLYITKNQRAHMRQIIQQCDETYADWGFKDPRTCLTYPLWASELPEYKIIVIYRSLGELWSRYRYKRLRYYFRNPFKAWKLVKRWCEHNSRILTYLRSTQMEFVVLNYRDFMMVDSEFNRLQEFVGVKLNDRRQKKLYRGRSEDHWQIRFASWLAHKQTGCAPRQLVEQFEALRCKQ